jgi:F0F1-type ATP synthase membrane subunit b/b'
MAVTLSQMAEAYIASVEQQLTQAQEQAQQAQQIVEQIEQHLEECKQQVSGETVVQNEDGTTTTTIPVNPFVST